MSEIALEFDSSKNQRLYTSFDAAHEVKGE
jgi:hypothetical protein